MTIPQIPGAPQRTPWYKKPLTYALGIPVALLIVALAASLATVTGKLIEVTVPPEVLSDTPGEIPTEDGPTVIEGPMTDEEIGLEVLRDEFPQLHGVSDDMLNDVALAACDALDAGATFDMLIAAADEVYAAPGLMGAITGYALYVHCPQHSWILED